jgi:hypothetical protein
MTSPADVAAGARQPKPHCGSIESGKCNGFSSRMCVLRKPAFTLDQVRAGFSGTPHPDLEGLLTVIRHLHCASLPGVAHGLPVAAYHPGGHCLGRKLCPDQAHLAFGRNADFRCRGRYVAGRRLAYFSYLSKLRRDIVRLKRARSYTYIRRFPPN